MLQVHSAPLLVVACQHLHISVVTAVGCCATWATAACCHLTLTTSDLDLYTVLLHAVAAAAAAAAATAMQSDKDMVQAGDPEQKYFH